MPTTKFHACRLRETADFEPGSFRTVARERVEMIVGRLRGERTMTAQAIRYAVGDWSEEKARAECKKHGGLRFEPATSGGDDLHESQSYSRARLEPSAIQWELLSSGMSIRASEYAAIDDLPTETLTSVPIFEAGQWTASNGTKKTYTEADLDEMVANHRALGERVKPFFKLMHLSPREHLQVTAMPALGWLANLRREGRQLFADIVRVPRQVAQLVRAGSYRRISAEIFGVFRDEVTGREYKNVVGAAGLLGAVHPAVNTLGDVIKNLFGSDAEAIPTGYELPGWAQDARAIPGMLFAGVEITQGGDDMDKAEVQAMIDGAMKVAAATHEKEFDEYRASVNTALGLHADADPVAGIKKLRSEAESSKKDLADRETREFASKRDALILQATKDGKLLPAEKPAILDMVEAWQQKADESGKLTYTKDGKETSGTVLERLEAHFASRPKHGIKLGVEQGADGEGSGEMNRYARVPEDSLQETSAVSADSLDGEIQKYATDHKCDYMTAFMEVTGARVPTLPVGEQAAHYTASGDTLVR